MSILIGIFTFVLILISVFLVLLVLAQKAQTDGAMGATLGGGATEAAFGADTGNVLTKATKNAAVLFFVLTFGLYLAHIYVSHNTATESQLPVIEAPAEVVPAPTPTTSGLDAIEAPALEQDAEVSGEAPSVTLPSTTPAETSESTQP